MKVDKGVCTSNDDSTTTHELNSIIKFETVFTTLVENKILAIKRECEHHESKKKSCPLKGILLRKPNNVDNPENAVEEGKTSSSITIENRGVKHEFVEKRKKRKNFFAKYYQKSKDFDIEEGHNFKSSEKRDELVKVVIVQNDNNTDDHEQGLRTYQTSTTEADVKLDSQLNNLDEVNPSVSTTKLKSATIVTAEDENKNCDKLNNDSQENAKVPLSPSRNSSKVIRSRKEHHMNYENDESLATTADISLQDSSPIVVAENKSKINISTTAFVPINNIIINSSNKSEVAICDDGASSQNTSDIDFSLASENSINPLPSNVKNDEKSNTKTNSDPIFKKFVNVLSPKVRNGNKGCERKASSCQSTPLFGRHKHTRSESEGKKVLKFQADHLIDNKNASELKGGTKKSQTIVTAPYSNTTTTTALAKPSTTITSISSNLPLEVVHSSSKKGQKHTKRHCDVSLEYEITYDDGDGNQSPHGFISSFNQLTSQKQTSAKIVAKQLSPSIKEKQEFTKQQDINFESIKEVKDQDIELELTEITVDVVKNKRKKEKQLKIQKSRHSDSETSNAIPIKNQCILKDQPILDNGPGFVNDVSQTKTEFNDRINSTVPPENKRHTRKHHHDHERCRKKRRKRKILVHNLDDKSMKVIDPDELPQRAKFTIVATACLLLIMCLLLVGVTLRMAPLIDDMVRQENDRLLQESINRAKMAINFTEPPPPLLIATTSISSLPSYQQNFQ